MRRTLAAALVLVFCALLVPHARAQNEKVAIADVAPLESFFVVNIPDWPRAKTALLRSEVGKLWAEPEVKAFVDEFMKEELGDRESGAGEVWAWFEKNVDLEDLREPTGGVGVTVFAEPKEGGANANSRETHDVHLLAVADFGEHAEAMMTMLADIFERLQKDGHIKLDESDYEGTDIYIVTIVPTEDEEDEDMDFGDEDDDEPKPMMVARSGAGIMVSSSRRALETAIDLAAGRGGNADTLADNRTYAAALAQHPDGSHAMVVGIASEFVRGQIKGGIEAMLAMFAPPGAGEGLVGALGIGAVEAFGVGLRMDTEAGTAEQSIGILAPRKQGLLTLVDSRLDAFTPPAFVPADAMSVYSAAVRFDRIPEVLRSIIKALPPEMQTQAGGMEAFIDTQLTPITNALGSELHVVQVVPRPFEPREHPPLIAIRVKDALAIANFINQYAPMMGMAARVFEGNQIFQREDDDSFALGIGFDHVFVGGAVGVENAFRLASRPDAQRLASAERFRLAAGAVAEGGAFYSYSNTAESMEHTYWQLQNAEKIYEAQIADWGLDEEMRKEFIESFREEQPGWTGKLPPLQVLMRHLGDSVTEIRPTPDGFRGRTIFLRP